MNTDNLVRATFVLDRKVSEKLTFVSDRFGRSRSDIVRELLQDPVDVMYRLVRGMPDNPTAADLRQLEIDGLDLIDEALTRHLKSVGG